MSTLAPTPVRLHGLEFDLAGMSEQGPRSENQDAYSLEHFEEMGIVAVADGMGGERGGRLAADTALQALLGAAPVRSHDDARRAVRRADQAVERAAEEDPRQRAGMGCALALLALVPTRSNGPGWITASVGDVRVLSRSPDGTTRLETRDHTPAFARWEAGEIELDEIPEAEGANRLQRAIGRGGEADVGWLPARPGWSYLLLSDGVTKAMRLDELGEAMAAPGAAATCDIIRRKVAERGPDDNYTAVAVRIIGDSDATDPEPGPNRTLPFPEPVRAMPASPPRRSAAGIVALLLSLLALGAAGFALWTLFEGREGEAQRGAEISRLQMEVDSLRARVSELAEPFGPSADTPPPTTSPGAPR
jgi:serine/threonine protein phosphatase PrpC